ncbi:MAG: 16S rRNA (cytidine(1402)-2'-O)-methyltransferase [Mucilaginibacter polytrichastri]|nr:16S rRNA (cytidine(1402)-2'-O)-methyltransferase [Mucilaginibacter polytrichastri]
MAGKLHIVPTPVGNLDDMTFRAISVLKAADIILAEDTRTSAPLLKHFGIESRLMAHHQHNEHQSVKGVLQFLAEGKSVALVSDAGTPGISDPGFLLVREVLKAGFMIECLPGATAFVPALVCSGLPADRFCFEGFLPVKKGRQTRLQSLADEQRTMIFYESPHRLLKSLEEFSAVFGEDRPASVSREISKMYEETVRGTLREIHTHFSENAPRGEFVLCVGGAPVVKKEKGNKYA